MLKLMLKRFLIAGAIFIFCILLIYLCGYFYIIFLYQVLLDNDHLP